MLQESYIPVELLAVIQLHNCLAGNELALWIDDFPLALSDSQQSKAHGIDNLLKCSDWPKLDFA